MEVIRALRRLATFHRKHRKLEVVMERDDELRAIDVVTKTLKKLPDWRSRARVLKYVSERFADEEMAPMPVEPASASREA
jgi:hypothetical protein